MLHGNYDTTYQFKEDLKIEYCYIDEFVGLVEHTHSVSELKLDLIKVEPL